MNLTTEQSDKLLTVIGTQQRRGSFASCKVSFTGTLDTETLEAFLAAATSVEQISDEDASKGIPLILEEETDTWWNGIKEPWTDESIYALRAVLEQGERENEHPVEYASRLITPAERNYSTTEREALAVETMETASAESSLARRYA